MDDVLAVIEALPRSQVDAWLEWEVSALVGDAAMSARSGEGE